MVRKKPHKDRNFLEAFLSNTEVFVDSLTENEAVKSIPVIGTAFKICKGVDDIRSKTLMAKLVKFISDPSLQSDHARKLMRERLASDPDQQSHIGEVLFLVIEKLTDFEKPSLLAKVFAAYLDDIIDSSAMLQIAHSIDITYIDHLFLLINPERPLHTIIKNETACLEGTGFVSRVGYAQIAFQFREAILREKT